MQLSRTQKSKILFIALAVGGAAIAGKLLYDAFFKTRLGQRRIKTVIVKGQRYIAREDLIWLLQQIREKSQEPISKTITYYRALRRKAMNDLYEYEECIKKMRLKLEKAINRACIEALESNRVPPAIFERSLELFEDREIQGMVEQMGTIKKCQSKKPISRKQILSLLDFYESIQKSILESTDIQAFDSSVLSYQIEDKIWQEFGIEINDIDWNSKDFVQEANLKSKMREISQYLSSIQKLNKSLFG